jgi:hypothetical protein
MRKIRKTARARQRAYAGIVDCLAREQDTRLRMEYLNLLLFVGNEAYRK